MNERSLPLSINLNWMNEMDIEKKIVTYDNVLSMVSVNYFDLSVSSFEFR